MNKKCEKFTVSGRVQGVGFRYHTSHQGLKFGLTGYAKNLNSGDVEVMVCGESLAIEQMANWLEEGPRTAAVESVQREEAIMREFRGFEIL
ncbi:acylphosphatase [Vibrio sp. SCSIO 43135]|uniref:Acylphosphatase n=1 Tax=Vibrio paucivorans TaxID=2829489 RepID=A0A9X3HSG5_9VIBR|nr:MULTISPECIES: acylphosphatase [Vibrio]MCW8334975.1 acylphosphatase [Vibrio paucivorans]USD42453.1 acylphosphatase [Vibrio sp. SCSIO 43135]